MENIIIIFLIDIYIIVYLIRSVFFVAGLKKEIEKIVSFKNRFKFLFLFDTTPGIYKDSPEKVIWIIRISFTIALIVGLLLTWNAINMIK